jgi:hypothetical protein
MLRNIKRERGRVPVLPTMAARSTVPEAAGNPELAGSARRDPTPGRSHNPTASLSDTLGPTQVLVTDKPATAPLPTSDKPVMPAGAKPAANAARPTAPEAVRPTAPPGTSLEAPTDTRRVRQWLKIAASAASLVAVAAGWWLYRSEVANHVEMTIPPATRASDDLAQVNQALQQERDKAEKLAREQTTAWRELRSQTAAVPDNAAQNQELTDLRLALQQERDKAERLARELATAWRALRSQATALADNAAQNQELTDLRLALQQAEASAAAYQGSLAQERARNQGLEQPMAARRERATDKPATAPLTASSKPVIAAAAADDKPATIAARLTAPEARLTAPEAPGNPEALRLMARASLLLSQGNIGAARTVLDRAAETGSALALFALAETYDPIILAAWGTFGTQSDAAKARELYAKAFAGGVQEANDRLNALH